MVQLADYTWGINDLELWWLVITLALLVYFFKLVYHSGDYLLNLILTSSTSIILLASIFIRDSEDYFTFLRHFVSSSVSILLFLTVFYNKDKSALSLRVSLLIIIIFFNPILPIYLYSRRIWLAIDSLTVIILVFNNVYSFKLDRLFTIERRNRIKNFYEKRNEGILGLLVPYKRKLQYSGGCIATFIIGLIILIVLTLFTLIF